MDASELSGVMRVRANGPAGTTWIHSAGFDLALFILSPLAALPLLILSPAGPGLLALAYGSLLGFPHYLSTFVFFFWDETRAIHRAKWPLFFGVPVLIMASLGFAAVFRIPFVIQVVIYVWNVYHVSRQSCGILSIYRHRAGVKDPAIKSIVNSAIVSTSFAMAFWNIAWYPTMHGFLTALWSGLPSAVGFVTAGAAVVSLARLAVSLGKRFGTANRPQTTELLFLATSLLLFHPYLWIEDSNRATLGMLVGHFVQYLGIVWLVHRRKFAVMRGPVSQPWLAKLSTNLTLLLAAILMSGGVFLALQLLSDNRLVQATYEALYLSLALVHFYLDGLFWAFKRPEVRASLGPYLLASRAERVAAT